MRRRALLDRLRYHQDAILAIMRDAEPLLADPARRDVPQLARARWTLVRALTAYQLFKHNEIFDPVTARRLPGDVARAARMKQACTDMGEEFRRYVSKWSGCDVAGEWTTYQPAALAMIGRLREHIAREQADVTAMLAAA